MKLFNSLFYILVGLTLYMAIFVDLHIGIFFTAPLFLIRGIIELFVKK